MPRTDRPAISDRYGEIAAALAVAASLTDVARVVVVEVLEAIGATQGVLAIPDRERRCLRLSGTRSSGGAIEADVALVPLEEALPIARAFTQNATIYVEDTDTLTHELARAISVPGARALACIPLRDRETCVGVLRFGFPQKRAFTESDRTFLDSVARITTLALQRAHAFEREQAARLAAEAANERFAFLARASEMLASAYSEEQVFVITRSLTLPRLGDFVSLRLVDPDGHPGKSHFSHIDSAIETEPLTTLGSIRIPIQAFGSNVGLLQFGRARTYVEDDRVLARELGRRIGSAIEHVRAHERDRKAAEQANALAEAAARARAEAEDASRLKDEFLSVASHELRTPVTTMQLLLQTLLRQSHREGVPEEWISRLHKVDTQSRRLVALIDSLLDVSRIGAGRLCVEPEDVDLVALVRSVVSRFEDQPEIGSAIAIDAPTELRGTWDPVRIDQVLTNLINNAIKYGRGQPIRVRIEADEDNARVIVADLGIGVAPENLERIFGRFERLESVRNYGGFGIGLWIVRELLCAMGGAIRVESRVGVGSTFTVELPR